MTFSNKKLITGSGKSTFCKHLSEVGWKRVSQDELGSRSKCESKVVEHLCKGMNVVVDRCNFDKSQRKTWLGKCTKDWACDCERELTKMYA